MDTAPLREAYRRLLDAAATVTESGDALAPEPGEWHAEQVLAHVSLVTAVTVASAAEIAAATNTTYDNRVAQDTWTVGRVVTQAGGADGLRNRVRAQADALCALGAALSDAELDVQVPTLLLSRDALMVDQLVPLRGLFTGLADQEIPGHTRQLLALLGDQAPVGENGTQIH